MIVGNPSARTPPPAGSLKSKALTFRCFDGPDYNGGARPGDDLRDSASLPKIPCKEGIRSNIYFPS